MKCRGFGGTQCARDSLLPTNTKESQAQVPSNTQLNFSYELTIFMFSTATLCFQLPQSKLFPKTTEVVIAEDGGIGTIESDEEDSCLFTQGTLIFVLLIAGLFKPSKKCLGLFLVQFGAVGYILPNPNK